MNKFNIKFLLTVKINIHILFPHTKREEKIEKKKKTRKTGVMPLSAVWASGVVTKIVLVIPP